MWTLEGNEKHPGRVHHLPCGQTLMVSRKDGHVLLTDDNSISRQHATIVITHAELNLKNPNERPQVRLQDLGAKYGTYVNDGIEQDKKIVEERLLMDGDRIRFGMLTNTWRLKYRPLVVTTSALKPTSKVDLQNAFLKLGGHIVSDWTGACQYLVMNNITLTIKVVCALAAAKPIVKPDFFCNLIEAILKKTPYPEASKYLPPLQEMSINPSLADFSPNEQRSRLLCGRTFLFASSRQYKRMGFSVQLAGGDATLLSEENYKLISSDSYLLVQIAADKIQDPARSQIFLLAKELLKGRGLRAIPESEIGLAILYKSTETNCNPSFKVSSILKRNGSSSTEEEGIQIYATETQDTSESSMSITGTRIVPETATSSSRRTPASLRGTVSTLPPSLTNLVTLSNSSSASTNASMLPPMSSNISVTDGHPVSQNSRKRLRTSSMEIDNKQRKRCGKLVSEESNEPVVDPTQPMEDFADDNSDEAECQLVNLKFEPQKHSTQKPSSTCQKHDKENVQNFTSNQVNGMETTVNDIQDGNRSLEPTVGRSLPFEPYTLPSLKTDCMDGDDVTSEPCEDDIATQTYTGVKEEPSSANMQYEPVSLISNEQGHQNAKRRLEEEIPHQQGNDTSAWYGGKKKKTENADTCTNNAKPKSEKMSFDGFGTSNLRNVKEELQDNNDDDDFFAVPSTIGRNRRTAEAKRKNATEDTCAQAGEIDYFAVPSSSRAERRQKIMKTEAGSSRMGGNKELGVSSGDVTAKQVNVTALEESRSIPKNGSWISKGSSDTTVVHHEVTVKEEPKHGDVAELSRDIERSLVVVEVASLVRQNQSIKNSASYNQNTSVGSLKNFKKFKKKGGDITSLPKIIGGKDLVSHDMAASRRDDWFRDNPDVTLFCDERQSLERANNDDLDALFNVPVHSKSRARMRR